MPFLASDVMDDAANIYLNDTAKAIYTYAALLPMVSRANRELEKLLVIHGAPQQRMQSSAISVAANSLTLTLPSDFLVPIRLFERNQGGAVGDWAPMFERIWTPENYVPTSSNTYWNFNNNNINFPGATVNKEVLLEYERVLAVISGQNSPEDSIIIRDYLGARVAEQAARYIGMNSNFADEIMQRDVAKAEDDLLRIIVLNQQAVGQRRTKFTSQRLNVY